MYFVFVTFFACRDFWITKFVSQLLSWAFTNLV